MRQILHSDWLLEWSRCANLAPRDLPHEKVLFLAWLLDSFFFAYNFIDLNFVSVNEIGQYPASLALCFFYQTCTGTIWKSLY